MTLKPLVLLISTSSALLSGCFWDSGSHHDSGASNTSFPANSLAVERGFAKNSTDR